jgi:predicted TPR repeat methyltransferase
VAGRRILDAGCGSGPLSAALRDRGAIVTGIDSSAKMLELARQRLGAGADLHLADLGSPLPLGALASRLGLAFRTVRADRMW